MRISGRRNTGAPSRSSRPGRSFTAAAITAAVLTLALAGCTTASVDFPAPATSSPPDRVADVDGTPKDAAIAASCGAIAATDTLLHNARTDLELGTITTEQHNALLDSAVVTYRSLQVVPASQRGLRSEINAVVSYLDSATPTESLAPFDPDSGEFRALFEPIRLACEDNGSEIYVFATTGG